ncbi:MAG: carboxypeptidase regulatory-like domain-containing protein [Cyclobacteriaceae bacterium]
MRNPLFRFLTAIVLSIGVFSACNENTIDPVFYGSIQGTVTFESSGTPAAGAEISTIPTTSTVLTDDQGNFSLPDVPTGPYSVVASLEGYKNATNKITVNKNITTYTDIQLSADATAPNKPGVGFPAPGAENIERSITLKWTIIELNDDELTYDVVLYESNVPTPLLQLDDYPDTLVNVENLKFNTTYFWQVNVKNSADVVTNGDLWQFKTRPFPDNRYLFTSQRDGNYEIYSSNETGNDLARLTYSDKDQVHPQYSNDRSLIAYTENTELAYHIYIMNKDGSSPLKVTSLPVAGFHSDGKGFCWSPDNGKLLYSHYDKLYTIDRNGSNLTLVSTAPAGRNFRACDWTSVGNRIVVETVGTLPYESEIRLIDLVNGTDDIVIPDEPGTIQSPSFSVDGNFILFTRDVSEFESPSGRQLDSRPFIYNIATGIRTDLSKDKVSGTNDLNPGYSPDGAKIIFENRSNDGSGQPSIYMFDISKNQRTKLFDNAAMPDWQ